MGYWAIVRSILYRPFLDGIYKLYQKYLEKEISKKEIPKHIGIILDGNRRWASKKKYPTQIGHRKGAENTELILEWCNEIGINIITLYVLSTENLERQDKQLEEILEVVEDKLIDLLNDERIHRFKINVKSLGRISLLNEEIRTTLLKLEETTKEYSDHFLNIAIAYGGRTEILDSVKKIVKEVIDGKLKVEEINLKTIEDHLYTSHLQNPEPDMIIRTSGEERLSGFLLWQSAYSELVFLDVYWPDFRKIDLMRAIRTYQHRTRRFGK